MGTSLLGTNDICARVRARWAGVLPQPMVSRADHNIALTIFGGCERLAKSVKESTDRALLMVQSGTITPSSGVIDLTVSGFNNIFIDTYRLPGAIVTFAESVLTFKHVVSMDALRATTPTDTNLVWYHLRGKTIVFKNPSTGALNTYATALNLLGSYIPVIGDATRPLPMELDDQLIDRVAEVVKELGGLQFLQADPDQAATAANQAKALIE